MWICDAPATERRVFDTQQAAESYKRGHALGSAVVWECPDPIDNQGES